MKNKLRDMETYQAIYLIDFYVGNHHIFKVGMSANPRHRADCITQSLFDRNTSTIQAPLYKFVNEVIHWQFKSVWKSGSGGRQLEELLLNRLKDYSDSLGQNNEYYGRSWNWFDGMCEAFPIMSKDVCWMKNELSQIMDRETKTNRFFIGKTYYEGVIGLNLIAKKKINRYESR